MKIPTTYVQDIMKLKRGIKYQSYRSHSNYHSFILYYDLQTI